MAVQPITYFTSEQLLLKFIILTLDSTRTLADLNTYTSNQQLLYEIYSLMAGGSGTAGLMQMGFVLADGTATTAIPALAGKTPDTNLWIFHSGTKRDTALEISAFSAPGTITWVAGFEPAAGTRIDYVFF